MPACPYIAPCRLERTLSTQEALRVWESFYCDGMFRRCERYKLLAAGGSVPDALLPNGKLVDAADAAAPTGADRGRR